MQKKMFAPKITLEHNSQIYINFWWFFFFFFFFCNVWFYFTLLLLRYEVMAMLFSQRATKLRPTHPLQRRIDQNQYETHA